MRRLIAEDRAKLALASALIQVANFLVLLVAKTAMAHEEFAFLLTQLAIAGIVGAIASMRLEILVFQAHERMTYAAILVPVAAIFGVTALSFVGFSLVAELEADVQALSPLAIPMMVGLALSVVQNFVFVQVKRLNLLLAARAAQAGTLAALVVVLLAELWKPSGREILFVVGIGYAVPSLIWIAYYLWRMPSGSADPPAFYMPNAAMLKRAVTLTVATGVNSVYVNLPLLAAAATQSASFVGDFGLLMRAFTAPITLIGQVIGRLYLADAIRWSISPDRTPAAMSQLIFRTMVQSVSVYLVVAPVLIGLLWIYREALNFSHFGIAPYLFVAALGQCIINPVSQVRIPLRDERAFLLFDAMRVLVLALGLYGLAMLIAFEIAFGATALVLYLTYIAFILSRLSRSTPE